MVGVRVPVRVRVRVTRQKTGYLLRVASGV